MSAATSCQDLLYLVVSWSSGKFPCQYCFKRHLYIPISIFFSCFTHYTLLTKAMKYWNIWFSVYKSLVTHVPRFQTYAMFMTFSFTPLYMYIPKSWEQRGQLFSSKIRGALRSPNGVSFGVLSALLDSAIKPEVCSNPQTEKFQFRSPTERADSPRPFLRPGQHSRSQENPWVPAETQLLRLPLLSNSP